MNRAQPAVAILDTNAVIGLAKGDCLHLISCLFREVCVPPLVVFEVKEPESAAALRRALDHGFRMERPQEEAMQCVQVVVQAEADAQVLALALSQTPAYLITSDRALQKRARRLGIPCIDTVSVVLILVRVGLLPAARPVLDRMRARGFGIPEQDYQAALRLAGE